MLLKVLFSVALVMWTIDATLNPHELVVEEEYRAEGSKVIQTFDSSPQELAHVAAQKKVNELLETGDTRLFLRSYTQPPIPSSRVRQAESQRARDRVKGQACLPADEIGGCRCRPRFLLKACGRHTTGGDAKSRERVKRSHHLQVITTVKTTQVMLNDLDTGCSCAGKSTTTPTFEARRVS